MDEMMSSALVLMKYVGAIFGSSIVTLIIAKRLNQSTDDVKEALLEQEFYKNLVDDYKVQMADYKSELAGVKAQLKEIAEQNALLINKDEISARTIKQQTRNLLKWEGYCESLKKTVKDRDKTNSILLKEIALLEKKQNG
tara:strand:- start:192 stop:611 length:420 start_codon:yes stop_codon:yes gene_type:complete